MTKAMSPFDVHGVCTSLLQQLYPDQDEESLLKKNLETGLTFSSDGKTCYLHIISGNDALLKNIGRRWQGIFGYDYGNEALEKARFKGSFEIKDGVLTFVEVPDDYRILPLQLLVTLDTSSLFKGSYSQTSYSLSSIVIFTLGKPANRALLPGHPGWNC
ncbi:MAG: hypothetical protein R3D26_20815 [Cyanobacteriota/Melainabacteria group bacterium]